MGLTLPSRWTTVLSTALLVSAGTALHAEPLPMPSIDYQAKAKSPVGTTMTSRHSNGKLRVEMEIPGMPKPTVAYLDLKSKKMIMTMSQPGMPPMAMEADFSEEDGLGVASGNGQRIGNDTVAGEACELWQIETKTPEERKANPVACITADGIPLRVEVTVDGKREVAFEVTELLRTAQDPKLFTPPADVQVMQLPKGMMPPRK